MDITHCDLCRDPEFETLLNSIHYETLNPDHEDDDIIEISPLRIVSVVVCTDLPDTVLDLARIYNVLEPEYGDDVTYNPVRLAKGEKPPPGKKKMFYNCMLWKIQVRDGPGDDNLMNVSLKIFPNGKFQYAGFNSIHAIRLIPRIVTAEIRKIDGAMQPPITKIEDIKMIQINSCFYLLKDKKKWQIRQITLNELLLKHEHVDCGGRVISSTFMPEKYPGINVKFKIAATASKPESKITLLIFATGSVLINGHNDLTQYREAYYMLCNLIHTHRKELITENLLG
tara:strand:- start:1610 stop:2461 length:852 start_codon:yes stop_codon:yes gene_type:complete